jgi:cytochrome b6-f complex iron-sulfur subunit
MDTPIVLWPAQTRREFCVRTGQAAAMLAAGVVAGCGGGGTSPSSTNTPQLGTVAAAVAGRVVSVAVDGSSALNPVGSAVSVQTSLGPFLVAHTAQDTFVALTATCTHEGCTITGFGNNRFVCPCHGSQYSTSGGVVMGPASRSLQAYPTQFANGVLTFTV